MDAADNSTEIKFPFFIWVTPVFVVSMLLFVISILSLILNIVSYSAIKKLRSSEPGQMVLNLSIATLLHHISIIMYALSKYLAESEHRIMLPLACVTTEMLVTYTIQVVIFLMTAEAVNAFYKFVLVFKTIQHYVLKAVLISWVTPILIIAFMYSNLIYKFTSTESCFQPNPLLYLGVALFSILLQSFVWITFFAICCVLVKKSKRDLKNTYNRTTTKKEIKNNFTVLFTLSVLFGLPFLFISASLLINTIPKYGPIFLFVSGLMDLFQGPLLFIVQGVRLPEVRQLWKSWLLCRCQHSREQEIPMKPTSQQLDLSQSTLNEIL